MTTKPFFQKMFAIYGLYSENNFWKKKFKKLQFQTEKLSIPNNKLPGQQKKLKESIHVTAQGLLDS